MKNKVENNGLRLSLFMLICLSAIFAIITFIIEPLYLRFVSDITIRVTVLPSILDILRILAETLAFAVCYSVIIFTAVNFGTKRTFGIFGVYAAICTVRRLCVLVMTFIIYHSIEVGDIFNICVALAFECILALVVALISLRVSSSYNQKKADIKKAAGVTGDFSKLKPIEFNRVFSRANPFLLCSFICACILTVYNIFERILYDFSLGAPDGAGEIIMMVAYYISDILFGMIFYAVCWLILSKLFNKAKDLG